MTRSLTLPELALLTLRDPKSAGEIVLGWNLSREAAWTGVALVSVVVTILTVLSNMVIPLPEPFAELGARPFIYLLLAVGGFVATVHAIYWTGRMMGGQGSLQDLTVLLLWLYALRAAAQAVIIAAVLVAPVLGSLIVLFVALATIWIFVNFISLGLRFASLWRSVAVLVVGFLAFVLGMSLLLSLIGISAVGVPPNV